MPGTGWIRGWICKGSRDFEQLGDRVILSVFILGLFIVFNKESLYLLSDINSLLFSFDDIYCKAFKKLFKIKLYISNNESLSWEIMLVFSLKTILLFKVRRVALTDWGGSGLFIELSNFGEYLLMKNNKLFIINSEHILLLLSSLLIIR